MSRLSFLCITLFISGAYLITSVQIDNRTSEGLLNVQNVGMVQGRYVLEDSILAESINRGKKVYMANCLSCHMPNGEGIEGAFPPLAQSDYLMADSIRAIRVALYGQSDTIKVNGVYYSSPSPALNHLTNQQMADVMNYIRNSWGNKGGLITPEVVADQRNEE